MPPRSSPTSALAARRDHDDSPFEPCPALDTLPVCQGTGRVDVAVVGIGIGIGCRYPGGVDGADALWQRLLDGTPTTAAGVDPATVGYMEAHRTGTPAGDPMEAEALCAVLGRSSDAAPCRVGSGRSRASWGTPKPPPGWRA